MALDPQAKALIDQMIAANAPAMNTLSPEDARRMFDMFVQMLGLTPEPVPKVEDRLIPAPAGQIRLRVYTPQGQAPFPALVFFHGGGGVIGSIDSYDELCRALTNGVGCVVVSVDYRLAPEHKFPTAVEDCYAATTWVAANAKDMGVDPNHIAVGGDSAGGNLAAVVAVIARDSGRLPLVFQLLMYPATDAAMNTPSIRENADGYFLTRADLVWFWNHYLRSDADRHNPRVSPLRARTLSGLPPALVITAEFDPLRDEGEAYAAMLREAGVKATRTRYDGMIHGFVSMPFDQGKKARQEAIAALRSAFGK